MSTPSTTYPTIRDKWISTIGDLIPDRLERRFESAPESPLPFREAAIESGGKYFRRFWIRRDGPRQTPEVSDGAVVQVSQRAILELAYHREWRKYDRSSARGELNLEDLADTDAEQIVRALGIAGVANYVSGQSYCTAEYRLDPTPAVVFLVVELEVLFYRSSEEPMPAATQTSAAQSFSHETTSESDEIAVTFPVPMHDTSYNVDACVEEVGLEGVICRLKPGTAAVGGCTISCSAIIPSGQTIAITVRDRS